MDFTFRYFFFWNCIAILLGKELIGFPNIP